MAGGKRKGEGNVSPQLYNKSAKGLASCQTQLEQRSAWCLDYVRALNTQFAAWVEQQKKDHLDELWEAGVEDYLKHARTLLTDYKDVVDWLKNSSSNNNNSNINSNNVLQEQQQQVVSPPCARRSPLFDAPLVDSQPGPPQQDSAAASAGGGATFGGFNAASMWTTSGTGARAGAVAERTPLPSMSRSGSVAAFRSPLPPAGALPAASESEKKDSDGPGSVAAFRSPLPAAVPANNETKDAQGPESSVVAPATSTPGVFTVSAVRSPIPIPSFARPPDITTTERNLEDEDQDAEAPGSPSFISTQEKGIQIVHQVRGKLYFQVADGEEKTWKDLGRGQIILRCKEGAPSTSKESKPTIVFRNEVGKILLNALLYTGLKANATKKDITLILLIAEPTQEVRRQACVFRLQSPEDAKALADAIQAHTPL